MSIFPCSSNGIVEGGGQSEVLGPFLGVMNAIEAVLWNDDLSSGQSDGERHVCHSFGDGHGGKGANAESLLGVHLMLGEHRRVGHVQAREAVSLSEVTQSLQVLEHHWKRFWVEQGGGDLVRHEQRRPIDLDIVLMMEELPEKSVMSECVRVSCIGVILVDETASDRLGGSMPTSIPVFIGPYEGEGQVRLPVP